MTFLLMCEGAEKCALRHLRRAEEMESLNFILHTRTGMQMAVSTPHTAKSTNALRASHVRRAMSSIHGWHAAASSATASSASAAHTSASTTAPAPTEISRVQLPFFTIVRHRAPPAM